MMFVSGETCDPPQETTSLIEDIVRDQVVELLYQASNIAMRRGSRSISPEDLIFLIRHDKAKVNRLRTYLSWKDVRKNARETEGGGVEGADVLDDTLSGQQGGAGGQGAGTAGQGGAGAGAAGGAGSAGTTERTSRVYKKPKIRLPWELSFQFKEIPLEQETEGGDGADDVDDTELEANMATIKRLKAADERTRQMTKEEYVHWSECRQASFTYRKGKRFREWAGISSLTDSRPQDDIIDILGFLTFEIVTCITEEALKVKEQEEELEAKTSRNKRQAAAAAAGTDAAAASEKKRKRERHLFDGPEEDQKPIMARHVQEGFRRMQLLRPKARALRRYTGGLVRTKTVLL